MNSLDLILLVFLFLVAWRGFRDGFIRSVIGLAGFIMALGVAYHYYQPLTAFLNQTWHLQDKLQPLLSGLIKLPAPVAQLPLQSLPTGQIITLGHQMGLPQGWLAALQGWSANSTTTLGEVLNNLVSKGLVQGLVFLLLLLIGKYILGLAAGLLTGLVNFGPLGAANRLAGLALGLVEWGIYVAGFLALLTPLQMLLGWFAPGSFGYSLHQLMEGSRILPAVAKIINILGFRWPSL